MRYPGEITLSGVLLQSILDQHHRWLSKQPGGKKAHLDAPDLWGLVLKKTNLARASMPRGNFQEAHLFDVELSFATLDDASFIKAELNNAVLKGASLRRANLESAQLSGANLVKTNLQEAHMHDVHAPSADFTQSNLNDADLAGGYFTGAVFRKARLRDAYMWGCALVDADLSAADLVHADLHGANGRRARFANADLHSANFNESLLIDSDFSCSRLENASFLHSNLTNANLTGAVITGCRLYGANLTNWNIRDVRCDYVYTDSEGKKRLPKTRSFVAGEFSEVFSRYSTVVDAVIPEVTKRERMQHVFISYVSEDSEKVTRIARDLENQKITVWIDKERLQPGVEWQLAIENAIRSGAFFMACFSESYWNRNANYMNEELNIAVEQLRKMPDDWIWFIPVKLTECEIPHFQIRQGRHLSSKQWVDLSKDWNRGIAKIVSMIKNEASDR